MFFKLAVSEAFFPALEWLCKYWHRKLSVGQDRVRTKNIYNHSRAEIEKTEESENFKFVYFLH